MVPFWFLTMQDGTQHHEHLSTSISHIKQSNGIVKLDRHPLMILPQHWITHQCPNAQYESISLLHGSHTTLSSAYRLNIASSVNTLVIFRQLWSHSNVHNLIHNHHGTKITQFYFIEKETIRSLKSLNQIRSSSPLVLREKTQRPTMKRHTPPRSKAKLQLTHKSQNK